VPLRTHAVLAPVVLMLSAASLNFIKLILGQIAEGQ
jgi:hypothetical protein